MVDHQSRLRDRRRCQAVQQRGETHHRLSHRREVLETSRRTQLRRDPCALPQGLDLSGRARRRQ